MHALGVQSLGQSAYQSPAIVRQPFPVFFPGDLLHDGAAFEIGLGFVVLYPAALVESEQLGFEFGGVGQQVFERVKANPFGGQHGKNGEQGDGLGREFAEVVHGAEDVFRWFVA